MQHWSVTIMDAAVVVTAVSDTLAKSVCVDKLLPVLVVKPTCSELAGESRLELDDIDDDQRLFIAQAPNLSLALMEAFFDAVPLSSIALRDVKKAGTGEAVPMPTDVAKLALRITVHV